MPKSQRRSSSSSPQWASNRPSATGIDKLPRRSHSAPKSTTFPIIQPIQEQQNQQVQSGFGQSFMNGVNSSIGYGLTTVCSLIGFGRTT